MNNNQKQQKIRPFMDAIHGWAFTGVAGLEFKIKEAERTLSVLPNELKGEAVSILNCMKDKLKELETGVQ